MRRRHVVVLALIAAFALPYWWLMVEGAPPRTGEPVSIDIAALREATDVPARERPVRIDSYVTAVWGKSSNLLAAGTGFQPAQLSAVGHVLRYRGAAPVVIDTGLTLEGARSRGARYYSPQRRAELDRAIVRARVIAVTRADGDHLDALTGRPALAHLAPRLSLGEEQRAQMGLKGWPAGARQRIASVPRDRAARIAPGVVTFPAPGARPDLRMVYVRLANGREVLFTGDVVSTKGALEAGTLPARLFSAWIDPIDRERAGAWLAALERLRREHPELMVVTGHDAGSAKSEFLRAGGRYGTVHFGLGEEELFVAL